MYLSLSTVLAIFALIVIGAFGWFWSDSLQARERMTHTCARICGDMQLQFLDETVALARLRLIRTANGGLAWRRLYIFEFSESGADRWKGRALLTGRRVESVQLDNPQGVTILSGAGVASTMLTAWRGRDPGQDPDKHLH